MRHELTQQAKEKVTRVICLGVSKDFNILSDIRLPGERNGVYRQTIKVG